MARPPAAASYANDHEANRSGGWKRRHPTRTRTMIRDGPLGGLAGWLAGLRIRVSICGAIPA